MEERINREVMEYQETIAGGLTLRQFIWAGIAVAASLLIYIKLSPVMGSETISWICILAAAPPALMGFTSWHGMTADQILCIFLKYAITPKKLVWGNTNQFALIAESIKKQDQKKRETREISLSNLTAAIAKQFKAVVSEIKKQTHKDVNKTNAKNSKGDSDTI